MDKSQVRKSDKTQSVNDEHVERLTLKIKFQQQVINELSSEANRSKIQCEVKAREMAILREKCAQLQRKVDDLKDNNPPRDVQLKFDDSLRNTLDATLRENRSMKRTIELMKDSYSQLASKCTHNPVPPAFDRDCNAVTQITGESKDSARCEKSDTMSCYEKGTDSWAADVAALKEEPTIDAAAGAAAAAAVVGVVKDDRIGTVETTPIYIKKNHTESEMNMLLDFNPVGALQEMCMYRNWTLPRYEISKFVDQSETCYWAECTVLTCTVKAKGRSKRVAKRMAATTAYHNVNSAGTGNVPSGEKPKKRVAPNERKDNRMVGDARPIASARCREMPDVPEVVGAPARPKDGHKVVPVSTNPGKKVVQHPSASLDTVADRLLVTAAEIPCQKAPVNEPVVVDEDEQPSLQKRPPAQDADLVNRLRLSNKPSVRELKQMKAISTNMVPSCVELLLRIADEEGLELVHGIGETCSLTIRADFLAVEITISSMMTVVGFGETIIECQENASYECLARIRSMLNE